MELQSFVKKKKKITNIFVEWNNSVTALDVHHDRCVSHRTNEELIRIPRMELYFQNRRWKSVFLIAFAQEYIPYTDIVVRRGTE